MLRSCYNILLLVERELFETQRTPRGVVSHYPAMNPVSSRNNAAYLCSESKSIRPYSALWALIENQS